MNLVLFCVCSHCAAGLPWIGQIFATTTFSLLRMFHLKHLNADASKRSLPVKAKENLLQDLRQRRDASPPGTLFKVTELSVKYVSDALRSDPGWEGVLTVFSRSDKTLLLWRDDEW